LRVTRRNAAKDAQQRNGVPGRSPFGMLKEIDGSWMWRRLDYDYRGVHSSTEENGDAIREGDINLQGEPKRMVCFQVGKPVWLVNITNTWFEGQRLNLETCDGNKIKTTRYNRRTH
jgi:hypothetical protein